MKNLIAKNHCKSEILTSRNKYGLFSLQTYVQARTGLAFYSLLCFQVLSVPVSHGQSLFCPDSGEKPSVNMPLEHFVYSFVERLETKRLIPTSIEFRNKPYTRGSVLKLIQFLENRVSEDPDYLNQVEKSLYQKLKGEFHFELSGLNIPFQESEREKHLIRFVAGDSADNAFGDAVFDQSLFMARFNGSEDSLNRLISYTTTRGRARGNLKKAVAYSADFKSTLIKGSGIKESNFQATPDGVLNVENKNVFSLEANAYMVIHPGRFRLQYGKDALILGPGKHSNLFISGNAPSFDNLRLDVSFDRVKFTFFHGFLRSERLVYNYREKTSDQKYIAGHRLEFKIFPWLFFAGNESVVYGGRGLEPQYVNPIMIYHIAEQYAGDKDNNTMSFDATVFPVKNIKTYMALFLDDYSFSRNPFRYWGQKWAFLWGLYWMEPLAIDHSDIRFEYSRVEPFVYTHKFGLINYSHFEKSLGSFLEPNSDDWYTELSYYPVRRFSGTFTLEYKRHGFGDINSPGEEQGYGSGGRTKKKFLNGVISRSLYFRTTLQFEPWNQQFIYFQYALKKEKNFNNTKNRSFIENNILMGVKFDY